MKEAREAQRESARCQSFNRKIPQLSEVEFSREEGEKNEN